MIYIFELIVEMSHFSLKKCFLIIIFLMNSNSYIFSNEYRTKKENNFLLLVGPIAWTMKALPVHLLLILKVLSWHNLLWSSKTPYLRFYSWDDMFWSILTRNQKRLSFWQNFTISKKISIFNNLKTKNVILKKQNLYFYLTSIRRFIYVIKIALLRIQSLTWEELI